MNKKINISFILLIIFTLFISEGLFGQDTEPKVATPQRPTFATSALTTFPGAFEIESGFGLSNNTFNTSITIKYGFGLQIEVFAGFIPYLVISNPEDYEGIPGTYLRTLTKGYGDTYVGGRYRFWMDFYEEHHLAVQLHAKIATARGHVWAPRSLGTGESDYTGFLIYTFLKEKYQFDLNFGLNLLGKHWESGPETQLFGAACLSGSLTKKLSLTGELYSYQGWDYYEALNAYSDNYDYNKDLVYLGLVGLGYSLKPTLVFDISSNFNLKNSPYDWQIVTGMTITL